MTAYIALGSNLGDRIANLRSSVERLRVLGKMIACSSVYETEPREYKNQPWFLNAVVAMETQSGSRPLMLELLQIETGLGRERGNDVPAKGPRRIDLDLLVCGDEVVDQSDLQIPHPRLHERLFVLEPLAEIAPELMHPVLKRSVRDLRDKVAGDESSGIVRRFATPLC